MDAFDADALIYAAAGGHPLGRRVAALFPAGSAGHLTVPVGVGSLLLLPEVLAQPLRLGNELEAHRLVLLLDHLDLRPLDRATADLAAEVGATYRLRAADATHLATAILAGADRFITNNRRDFGREVGEIDVVYPEGLPDPRP